MADILVVCEQRDGVVARVSLELIGQARVLAETTGEKVVALLLGYKIKSEANRLIGYGADKVIVVDDRNLKVYLTEQYAQAAYSVIDDIKPNIVLFGATSIGRDLAPRLSARLHTGLTADCTKLEADKDGNLFMTRPAFGGNLFATIVCPDFRPQMSTVRAGVFKIADFDESRHGETEERTVDWKPYRFRVEMIEEIKEKREGGDIAETKILVSCGRGTKDKIPQAIELASSIGGLVSCTRAIVDLGLLPNDRQVGQTGKTVRPSVYLALGISGAVQHLAGMEESEFIIAVNKDRAAPIFKIAHLGIVSDAKELIGKLIKELENRGLVKNERAN